MIGSAIRRLFQGDRYVVGKNPQIIASIRRKRASFRTIFKYLTATLLLWRQNLASNTAYNKFGNDRKQQSSRKRPKNQTPRTSMLNLHRLGPFKYDLREILNASPMDKTVIPTIVANIIAKASRVSVRETKEYIRSLEADGVIDKIAADDTCILLDRYSKWR